MTLDFPPSDRVARLPTKSSLDVSGLEEVEAMMISLAAAPGAGHLGEMAVEQVCAGGKRLRARMALAAARTMGAHWAKAVPWAAAVELLHNATLVHDDVQDGDRMRRGRPALWVRHGTAQALNAGNYMLMLPYRVLETFGPELGSQLCRLLAEHAIETVRGQTAELDLLPAGRLDWESYVAAASGKTGAMFALPVAGAALVAGRSFDVAAALGSPFVDLGVLFQIYDDVLDLYGDKGREAPGSDLREGKVSALVALHLARRPQDRAWLLDLLRAPRETTPEAGVARAIEAFQSSGAVTAALDRMAALADRVARALERAEEPGLAAIAAELVLRCRVAPVALLEGVA